MYYSFKLTAFLLPLIISGCGKKDNEIDFKEMQRKSDSLNRREAQNEKLRKLDSLAAALDSMKKDLEKMEKESDSMKKKFDSFK